MSEPEDRAAAPRARPMGRRHGRRRPLELLRPARTVAAARPANDVSQMLAAVDRLLDAFARAQAEARAEALSRERRSTAAHRRTQAMLETAEPAGPAGPAGPAEPAEPAEPDATAAASRRARAFSLPVGERPAPGPQGRAEVAAGVHRQVSADPVDAGAVNNRGSAAEVAAVDLGPAALGTAGQGAVTRGAVARRPAASGPDGSDRCHAAAAGAAPSLQVYLLSPFRVFANDLAIDEWPGGKGKSIFKYLVLHRTQPVPREVLMNVFWPDAEPQAARNNLNVALYGLRKALARGDAGFAFVRYRQGCYSLHPDLRPWVDAEAFIDSLHCAQVAEQRGERAAAIDAYGVAQALYHGALLAEDRYEDWLIAYRQQLQEQFMGVLQRLCTHHFEAGNLEACVRAASRMLEVDRCDEDAHRLLMRCYSRMGHAHLALRQYHFCVDALARELKLIPAPQTVALFHSIRQRQWG